MKPEDQMREALLDSDGENKAVRVFLLHYQNPGVRITAMRNALKRSGFDGCWPEFVKEAIEFTTLTKGGAQAWIRHLFALEQALNHTPDTSHVNETPKIEHDSDDVLKPAKLVRLTDDSLISIYSTCKAEWKATNKRQRQRIALIFGNAIMDAMIAKNGGAHATD